MWLALPLGAGEAQEVQEDVGVLELSLAQLVKMLILYTI